MLGLKEKKSKDTESVYVRRGKVEKYEKDGWKVVKSDFSDMTKSTAIQKAFQTNGDVVKMSR